MTCAKCGKKIGDGTNFCPGCGAEVVGRVAPNAPSDTSPTTPSDVPGASRPAGLSDKPWFKAARAVVGFAVVAVCAFCAYLRFDRTNLNDTAKQIIESGLAEQLKDTGLADSIAVDRVSDVTLVKKSGNEYAGLANVRLRTRKGELASDTLRYDLKGTYGGSQLLLEFKPIDSDVCKFIDLCNKAGLSDDDDSDDASDDDDSDEDDD